MSSKQPPIIKSFPSKVVTSVTAPPGSSTAKLAAFESTESVWKQEVSARAVRVRSRFVALAASVAGLAVVVALVFDNNPMAPLSGPLDSTIVRIDGGSIIRNGLEFGPHDPAEPSLVSFGDQIATGADARLAINWQGLGSLRLDQDSAITVLDDSRIRLERGSAYYDSIGHRDLGAVDGKFLRRAVLKIETPYGVAEHLGTQFLINADSGRVSVSVREGIVKFTTAEEVLRVDRNSTLLVTEVDAILGERDSDDRRAWSWVNSISPRITMDVDSTFDVLAWAAREQGLSVRYEQPEARAFAKTDQLIGLGDVDPQQALEMIPQITDLQYEVREDDLLVRLKPTL